MIPTHTTTENIETTAIRRVVLGFVKVNIAMFVLLLLGADPSAAAELPLHGVDGLAHCTNLRVI